MAIRPRPGRDAQRAAQFLGSTIELRLRATVVDLNNVDLIGDSLDGLFPQIPPAGVIRMFQVNQAALALDRGDRLLRRQLLRDCFLQEQADQLSFGGEDLLADHHQLAGLPEQAGAVDGVMVGQNDGGEAELPATAGYFNRGNPAVEGGRAVQVEVQSDQRGPCASGHVRYYRRTEEGSGMISGVAVGW